MAGVKKVARRFPRLSRHKELTESVLEIACILEELMLDLMYHLPSQKRVKEFEVTKEMVERRDVSLPAMEKAG